MHLTQDMGQVNENKIATGRFYETRLRRYLKDNLPGEQVIFPTQANPLSMAHVLSQFDVS